MIKLKHIYKSYSLGDEQVDVLHDINLHVKPKEFVSILGPSGSGKSTLMNIIGCLDIPDSGDYILDGEYVDNCCLLYTSTISPGITAAPVRDKSGLRR